MANSRIDYPTVQVANGFKGKAVKLETRNTGDFGAMVKCILLLEIYLSGHLK